MLYSSRISALRRGLNSHEAAKPQTARDPTTNRSEPRTITKASRSPQPSVQDERSSFVLATTEKQRHGDTAPTRSTFSLGTHWFSVSLLGRRSQQQHGWPQVGNAAA